MGSMISILWQMLIVQHECSICLSSPGPQGLSCGNTLVLIQLPSGLCLAVQHLGELLTSKQEKSFAFFSQHR